MAKVELSPSAEEDMREIWRYSADTWSERQANVYVDALFDAMDEAADAPNSGRRADDLSEGLLKKSCASHVIFYRERSDGVRVVRVLHKQMDFSAHLANDET
jgi:toxin ParE1/3/4